MSHEPDLFRCWHDGGGGGPVTGYVAVICGELGSVIGLLVWIGYNIMQLNLRGKYPGRPR